MIRVTVKVDPGNFSKMWDRLMNEVGFRGYEVSRGEGILEGTIRQGSLKELKKMEKEGVQILSQTEPFGFSDSSE